MNSPKFTRWLTPITSCCLASLLGLTATAQTTVPGPIPLTKVVPDGKVHKF